MARSYEMATQRISAKFQQKLGKLSAQRPDLKFCDHTDMGNGVARVLLAWDVLRGEPTVRDVEGFIWTTFGGKMAPKMGTARIHGKEKCIEMLVEALRDTLPMDAAVQRKMAVLIPGKTYVDKDRTTWEVRQAEDGTPYLVRKSEEDIDSILMERRKHAAASASLPKFRKLAKTAGYATAQPGDTVEFYHGTDRLQGQLKTVSKDNKATVSAGGTTFTIDRQAITRVVQHSEAYLNERKNRMNEYYRNVLGPELADKLLNLGPDITGP